MDTIRNWWDGWMSRAVLVLLVASIAGVGSERMFWFWSPDLVDHLIVVSIYWMSAGVTLWAIARYRVNGWWSLLLATPLYSLVTEGVLTPVTYSGGPFVPVFPAWFAFWHGILSFAVLVIGIRQLLMARRWRALAALSTGLGAFWAVWSITLWLPGNVEDPELVADHGGALTILDPLAFTQYAVTFTAVVAICHWLLGYVWPTSFEPGRPARWTTAGLALVVLVVWTFAVPWALPMFAAYAWVQRWGLRRHEGTVAGSDLFAQLAGRTPVAPLLALAPMAITAAGGYSLLWSLDPSEAVVRTIMWTTITVQAVAGFVISVMALRRSGRTVTVPRPVPEAEGGAVVARAR